jgi:hypothetical protein
MTTNTPDQPTDRSTGKARYATSVLVEHLLLGIAILSIIPPFTSRQGERYDFGRGPVVVMLLFLIPSRILAMRRGEESWFGMVLKAAILVVAGYVNYLRAF